MDARNSMERKKEQARRERENQARKFMEGQRKNEISTNTCLFSEPVKKKNIDPIAQRIQATLGKCNMENYRDAIGITQQPATPLPDKKRMSFPDRKPDSRPNHSKETEGAKRSLDDKNTAKNAPAKSYTYQSYLDKQRGASSRDPGSSSDKKAHPPSSSSNGLKADQPKPHHPIKKEHRSPSPLKKEQTTPTKNGPVNGKGGEEKGEGSNKNKYHSVNGIPAPLKPSKHHNLPPLRINKEVDSVEDILKEMTQMHQPHTAIQTPRKEEKFPFPTSSPSSKSASKTAEFKIQRNGITDGSKNSPCANPLNFRSSEREQAADSSVRALNTTDSKPPPVSVSGPGTNAPTKEQRMNSGDSSSSSEDEDDSNESDSESQSSEEEDKSDDNEDDDDDDDEDDEEEEKATPAKQNSSTSDKGLDTSKSSTCSTWALSNFIKTNVESPISQLPSSNDNSKLSDKPNTTTSERDNEQVISDLLANIDDHTGGHDWSPVFQTKQKHTQQKSPFSISSVHQSPPSRISNQTSSSEKLKTSTPDSKSRVRRKRQSEPVLSSDESQSENEEVDVESVTPGKEIIPEILRKSVESVSEVTKKLDFDRGTGGSVNRVTPNNFTEKKVKTKDRRDQTKIGSRRQSKENKENNDKKNHSFDDIKNIIEQITVNPPLSPIPNVPENSNPKPSIPGLTYNSNGKPSIIVHLNLSLAKPSVKCNTSPSTVCSEYKEKELCSDIKHEENVSDSDMDIDDDIVDSKVLIECPKPVSPQHNTIPVPFSSHYSPLTMNGDITTAKRKSDLDFIENDKKRARSDKRSSKRNSLGSSRERISHTNDHEWDMKHPQRSEGKERRSSSSSNSSQFSSTSKQSKKTKNQSTEPDMTGHQLDDKEELEVPGNGPENSGQYPSSVEMTSYSRGGEGDVAHVPSPQTRKSAKTMDDWCNLSPDTYLRHAKELKHQADNMNSSSDKLQRAMKYLESFIAFIQCGYAMERTNVEQGRIFTMYRDTNKLVSHISRLRGSHESNNNLSTKEKIISVLSLRIQSLLNLKLYKLKKNDTLKLKRAIEDYNKTTASKPPPQGLPISHAPSPHQNSWSTRSNRTPSPMSPTPSPAGSTGSLESRGSSTDLTPSKLPNGNVHMSPATIAYPQRIHSITQQYITSTGYLVQSHDLWDQADIIMQEVRGFFDDLEEHSETLTIQSSMQDLITYLQKVVEKLKDT
ncbi:AF4/FMR2 family member 4-like [Saccostrea cucullata]|uniref:AF4/FMR2 family member 4-like n=1 Tax=Saccostrea cuccullata TaxID=36930 RepID=UPI002ED0436A